MEFVGRQERYESASKQIPQEEDENRPYAKEEKYESREMLLFSWSGCAKKYFKNATETTHRIFFGGMAIPCYSMDFSQKLSQSMNQLWCIINTVYLMTAVKKRY